MPEPYTSMDAMVSPCGRYRYALNRVWDDAFTRKTPFVVIGLNPSTADATTDDPTIRRCVSFAKREDCGRLVMLNLFAWRATNPAELARAEDPVGPENDSFLDAELLDKAVVVAAWGAHPFAVKRAAEVADRFPDLLCFGTTKAGHPKHPLYLRADTPLVPLARAHPQPQEAE